MRRLLFRQAIERAAPLAVIGLLLAGCGHLFGVSPKDEEEAEVHNDLGATSFQNGQYQEAMQEFLVSIHYDPAFAPPHNGLGLVYMYYWTGPRMDDAQQEFMKAVVIDPHYADAWNNLGTLLAAKGDLPHAQASFEKALAEPFYKTPWIAQTNLGWVIHLEGKTEAGTMLLKQALVNSPMYCEAHYHLAEIYADEGQTDASDTEWQAYAKYCPKAPLADFHAGSIALKQGDEHRAAVWFHFCVDNAGTQSIGKDCSSALVGLPALPPAPPTPNPRAPETFDAPETSAPNLPAGSNAPAAAAPSDSGGSQ